MRGFTLVELAIVLVIIGLVIGGVLVGRDMIRAAELNSIPSDLAKYRAAATTFKDRYRHWPGDMPDAQTQWPACTPLGMNTCNGNGNGLIDHSIFDNSGLYEHQEHITAWAQLGHAGLMTPILSVHSRILVGTSTPRGRLNGTTFTFGGRDNPSLLALSFGIPYTLPSANEYRPTLTPEDTFNLDTKMDDGNANTGKLRGLYDQLMGAEDDCADSDTGVYAVTANTAPACYLIYYF